MTIQMSLKLFKLLGTVIVSDDLIDLIFLLSDCFLLSEMGP